MRHVLERRADLPNYPERFHQALPVFFPEISNNVLFRREHPEFVLEPEEYATNIITIGDHPYDNYMNLELMIRPVQRSDGQPGLHVSSGTNLDSDLLKPYNYDGSEIGMIPQGDVLPPPNLDLLDVRCRISRVYNAIGNDGAFMPLYDSGDDSDNEEEEEEEDKEYFKDHAAWMPMGM